MSSPIFQRIADELELPPDRSEKLVRAMIQEIRKRAKQGQGVRIPNLGSFSMEDGSLNFRPEPSLARAVNQRFEGLGDEPVALPEIEESAQTGEGPTTITRGFDMDAWDPLETGDGQEASSNPPTAASGPDTDEFQAPTEAPDTDEFEVPAEVSSDEEQREDEKSEFQPAGVASAASRSTAHDRPASSSVEADRTAAATNPDSNSRSASSASEGGWASGRAATNPAEGDAASTSTTEAASEATSELASEPVESSPATSEESIWGRDPESTSPAPDSDTPEPRAERDAATPRDEPEDLFDAESHETSEASGESATTTDPEAGDSKPSVWDADSSWDFSTVTSSDVDDDDDDSSSDPEKDSDANEADAVASDSSDDDPQAVSYRPPDAEEQLSEYEESGRSIFDFDDEAEQTKEAPKTMKISAVDIDDGSDPERPENESSGSSGLATTLTVTFLVLLVSAGAWIVLGQMGIVPSPSRTLGLSEGLTTAADAPADERTNASQAPSAAPSSDNSSAADASPTAGSPASSETTNESSAVGTTDRGPEGSSSSSSTGFNRAQGGYTIVVASRTSESQAQSVVEQFRRDLSDTNLPVDIVTGSSGNVTRYRVGIGQFSSLSDARARLSQMQSRLPNGSWPVQIQ